jgi:hypothetical protein
MPICMIVKAKELKLYLYIGYLSAYGLNTYFSASATTMSLNLLIRRLSPLFLR